MIYSHSHSDHSLLPGQSYEYNIPIGGDLYCIIIRDSSIMRITKYINGGNFAREIEFDELSERIKDTLIEKLNL